MRDLIRFILNPVSRYFLYIRRRRLSKLGLPPLLIPLSPSMNLEELILVLSIFDLHSHLIEVVLIIVYVHHLTFEEDGPSWGMTHEILNLLPWDATVILPELTFLSDKWMPASFWALALSTLFANIISHAIISVHLAWLTIRLLLFNVFEIYS